MICFWQKCHTLFGIFQITLNLRALVHLGLRECRISARLTYIILFYFHQIFNSNLPVFLYWIIIVNNMLKCLYIFIHMYWLDLNECTERYMLNPLVCTLPSKTIFIMVHRQVYNYSLELKQIVMDNYINLTLLIIISTLLFLQYLKASGGDTFFKVNAPVNATLC